MSKLLALLCLLTAASLAGPAAASADRRDRDRDSGRDEAEPLVIAHRGASGYRPEHTLAAYALGARMGADYIEPDLVSTKDGVLVARHENEISGTTDVADHPEFANRRTTKTIDGVAFTGWFTEDFTLAELKTLRAKERIPEFRQRNTIYNGRYEVPTLQEVIDLSRRLSRELDRPIGIYPETKHSTYFRSIDLPLEEPLVRTLRRNGLDGRRANVFVQSFEVGNLKMLNRAIDAPLVQLFSGRASSPADDPGTTYGEMATREGLREVARYADGVGPSKDYILPGPTSFVSDAHRAGLVVHPYTFRNENNFLPPDLRSSANPAEYGNAFEEYRRAWAAGVDGVFSDNPDTAVEAREDFDFD
jgi:glycerophosphoryl diester phosphodiesterase